MIRHPAMSALLRNAIRTLLATAGIASSATAATYSIQPDGTGDFATIQAAVDSANAGDEIVLEDGTFTGAGNRDIRFDGKDLIVRSRNGTAACTIDSQGSVTENHRAFRLDAGETAASRIEGITITGGFVEGVFPESGGGGILVADGSHPVIHDCVFDGNVAGFEGFGAGLLAWNDCDITLTDCLFVGGWSGWYGGGFTLRKFCDALVERCTVVSNYSGHAGGGVSITNSNPILNDCVFVDNETTDAGGGGLLVKAWAQPVLTRCVFSGNRAWGGGAVALGNEPEVTLIDCLFENNHAVARGGAINLDQDPPIIHFTGCTFVHNQAPLGGHMFIGFNSLATVESSILGRYCQAATGVYVATGATGFEIDCSVVQGGAAEIVGSTVIDYGPDNVDGDPLFCGDDPDSCDSGVWTTADYTLDSMSPAAPGMHPCGLAGAYPVACGGTSSGAGLESSTWGRIKDRYRASSSR